MVSAALPMLRELEEQINERTGRRVRNLSVELRPGRVVLRGRADSYYVKQLAQHGLLDSLPAELRVENAITVARSAT